MSDTHQDRIKEILEEALALAGNDRARFLDEQCGDDNGTRREVESLIHAMASDGESFLRTPVIDLEKLVSRDADAGRDGFGFDAEPTALGQYRINRLIGEGGMGRVFEATQEHPHRTVVVKLIRANVLSDATRQRFRREADLLGKLHHPGIAHVYDAGEVETEQGLMPYLVMEYVRGEPLLKYASRNSLQTADRLMLIARICDAVHHAHMNGVIHRDLKPANILVDESGQPKLLDFGIARPTDSDAVDVTMQTDAGQLIGTLAYMSPEQVSGRTTELDARSDVYALGVLTYELLSGELPYEVRDRSLSEVLSTIRDEEAHSITSINPRLRGDVATVVATALAKDRERRYQSAAAFASDIRRFLHDDPILARPPSAIYKLRKLAARNRTLMTGIAATLVVLFGGIVTTSWFAVRESHQREAAEHSYREERALAYRNSVLAALSAIRNQDAALAHMALHDSPKSLRGWEWDLLESASDRSLQTLEGHDAPVQCGVFSPDEERIISSGSDGTIRVWNATNGQCERVIPTGGDVIRRLVVDVTGQTVLAQGKEAITQWEIASGGFIWNRPGSFTVADRPSSSNILAVSEDGSFQITLLDLTTGSDVAVRPIQDPWAIDIQYYPSMNLISFRSSLNHDFQIMNLETGSVLWRVRGHAARFDEESSRLALLNYDDIYIHDMQTGEQLRVCDADSPSPPLFAMNDILHHLVVPSASGALRILDSNNNVQVTSLLGHHGRVNDIQISRDRRRMLTASNDGTLKIWLTSPSPWPFAVAKGEDQIYGAAIAPDGQHVVTTGWGGVTQWHTATGMVLWTRFVSRLHVNTAAYSDDGHLVAVGGDDGALHILDSNSGDSRLVVADLGCKIRNIAWIPRRSKLVVTGDDDDVRIIDVNTGEIRHDRIGAQNSIGRIAIANDGGRVALGIRELLSDDPADQHVAMASVHHVQLMDLTTGRTSRILPSQGALVTALSFSHDGTRLIVATDDRTVTAWDLASGEPVRVYSGMNEMVRQVMTSPDDSRVFAACRNGSLHVWDAESAHKLLAMNTPNRQTEAMAFIPGGQRVLLSGTDYAFVAYELSIENAILEAREQTRFARRLVDDSRTRLEFSDAVRQELEQQADLPDALRIAAIQLNEGFGDHVNYLNSRAWEIVRSPERSEEEYRRALRAIETTCRLWPDHYAFINTLGFVQYRVGLLNDALTTMNRCDEMHRREHGASHPVDLALIAMIEYGLGKAPSAYQNLQRAEELMRDSRLALNTEVQSILREARRLVNPTKPD